MAVVAEQEPPVVLVAAAPNMVMPLVVLLELKLLPQIILLI